MKTTKAKTSKKAKTADRKSKPAAKKAESSSEKKDASKSTILDGETPEPPQIMDPTSHEERERKKNS